MKYLGGLLLTDDYTDEILEWQNEEEEWGLGVWMEYSRAYHGVTSVQLDESIMKYCS